MVYAAKNGEGLLGAARRCKHVGLPKRVKTCVIADEEDLGNVNVTLRLHNKPFAKITRAEWTELRLAKGHDTATIAGRMPDYDFA